MNTISDALNRGFNLLATSIVAVAGFAFAPEMFIENEMADKADDALLFALALVAMGWYAWSGKRTQRSIAPVVIMVIALVVKIIGLIIELDDPDAMGDDAGGVILFLLATGLVIYQYIKTPKLAASVQQ